MDSGRLFRVRWIGWFSFQLVWFESSFNGIAIRSDDSARLGGRRDDDSSDELIPIDWIWLIYLVFKSLCWDGANQSVLIDWFQSARFKFQFNLHLHFNGNWRVFIFLFHWLEETAHRSVALPIIAHQSTRIHSIDFAFHSGLYITIHSIILAAIESKLNIFKTWTLLRIRRNSFQSSDGIVIKFTSRLIHFNLSGNTFSLLPR